MRTIFSVISVAFTILPLSADTFTLDNPQTAWKAFQYCKEGTVQRDGQILKIEANVPNKAFHYMLDQAIPLGKGIQVEVRFEWRGCVSATEKSRVHFASGLYLYDEQDRYAGKAYPLFGSPLPAALPPWQSVGKVLVITPAMFNKQIRTFRFFFSVAYPGKAEIKDFKITFSPLKKAEEPSFSYQKSFIPETTEFPIGKYWATRKVGNRDFYVAEMGNYQRIDKKIAHHYIEAGIFPSIVRGYWGLKEFDPKMKLTPWQKDSIRDFLENELPIASMNYQRIRGNLPPDKETIARVEHLWIGDGHGEEPIYRLEPVFYFMRTGKKWKGPSMEIWEDSEAVKYLGQELLPLLRKELPGCEAPDYEWTRDRMQKLKDIYCLSYLSVNHRPFILTMYLSPYAIAENRPDLVSVSAKGADSFSLAVVRGVAKQSGGRKFLHAWRGHEPTDRYSYNSKAWFNTPEHEDWGLPLPHLIYYVFRPYLAGMNYYTNECFPYSLIEDRENNGTWHPTELGKQVLHMAHFAQDYPNRGILYTPVAYLMGYDREFTLRGYGDRIPFDNADWMNCTIMTDLLLPEHRDVRDTGSYSCMAPYGEIMDILKPNPQKIIDPMIFNGYKLLVLGGGITISSQYCDILKKFVSDGGNLLVNAADAKAVFDEKFTGVKIGELFDAEKIRNEQSGKEYAEKPFRCFELTVPPGTKVLYSADGKPAVTLHPYGKGYVIVAAPEYLLVKEKKTVLDYRTKRQIMRPQLLKFSAELFENLFDALVPFTVKAAPENREDFSWTIFKNGTSWRLAVFNYSLKREALVARSLSTAKASALYPYKEVPFEIVAKVPVNDVAELFKGRDVNFTKSNGHLVVQETMHGGELRLYEFSQEKVELPEVERYVNYALNCPVIATSTYGAFKPEVAVDGIRDNDYFWQSDVSNREFTLPQSLTVDLQKTREIDHIYLQFHVWPDRDYRVRQHFIQYIVESSLDGQQWEMVIDERHNATPADMDGMETWFSPVKARYVRLTVLHNSGNSGAPVVEFAVLGKDKEKIKLKRKSINPPWQVSFPVWVGEPSKNAFLIDAKPLSVTPGWMPEGKAWQDLNGWVCLYPDLKCSEGLVCPKSLYGESVFSAEYSIPNWATHFISVCGFGNHSRAASVEFKVYVDGVLKYDSGLFRCGMRLLPVLVDIAGGKILKLETTDGKDGIVGDYAWWGDARFIRKKAND